MIPVAASSPSWSRSDAVDRGRVFDNTSFASQTGGAARAWSFTSPPVAVGLYEGVLGTVAAQLCSGDILSLPTMCHVEFMGGKPVRAQGTKVTLDFVLHEVQPAKVLLRYAPGDTITGESFSRASSATYINAAGVIQTATTNVKRDSHYIAGVRSLLLEDTATNPVTYSSDISQAIWVKTNMTVGTGIADPAGTTLACTLTATAGNATALYPAVGTGPDIVRTNSVWLRRRTGTGVVEMIDPPNSAFVPVTLTASWQRFSVTGLTSPNKNGSGIRIVTSGDAVDVFGFQQDDQLFSTSYIPTAGAAGTRGADIYSLPFTVPPQEMSVYFKAVDLGSVLKAAARTFQISDASGLFPLFMSYNVGGFWAVYHNPSGFPVQGVLSTVPAVGNTEELLARLFGNGSVDLTQSINSAASTSTTQTGPAPLIPAWSGSFVWLNSAGNGPPAGFTAIQSFKIVAGARALAEMRAA